MEKERLIWIDLLNIIACASVLLLHCTNSEVHNFSGTPSVDWCIGLTTHSFFLWPVNVFFMISGFTLIRNISLCTINSLEGVKVFYNKRMKRLAVPLLSWNILYMILYFVRTHINGEDIMPISELVKKFVLFDYNGFMWFFVPLLMIYLAMPFIAVFILNSSRNLLRLFLFIGLLMGGIPPIDTTFSAKADLTDIYLMGSRFIYFIVAGYYVGHYKLSFRTRKLIYTSSILCMVVMFIGTALLTLHNPLHYKYFIQYTNIPCTLSAIGVFTYFRYYNWNKLTNKLSPDYLAQFSSLSLGIYLIQGAWFTTLRFFNLCEEHILLKFIVMYALCVTSVYVMKKVPLARRLVQ